MRSLIILIIISFVFYSCKKELKKHDKKTSYPFVGSWTLDHAIITNSGYAPVQRNEIGNLNESKISFFEDSTFLENENIALASTTQINYTIGSNNLKYDGPINYSKYSINANTIKLEWGFLNGPNLSGLIEKRIFEFHGNDTLYIERQGLWLMNPRLDVFSRTHLIFVYKRESTKK